MTGVPGMEFGESQGLEGAEGSREILIKNCFVTGLCFGEFET